MTDDITNDLEVEGNNLLIILASWNDTDATYDRTVFALASKEDVSIPVDESSSDFTPGRERRTRRYRTSETVDVEVSSAISVDLDVLTQVGIAEEDTDGVKYTSDSTARRIGYADDEHIEIAYFKDDVKESDIGTVDLVADSEICHRFSDVKTASPEFDPSSTPPTASWTFWVEGDFYIDYTGE